MTFKRTKYLKESEGYQTKNHSCVVSLKSVQGFERMQG